MQSRDLALYRWHMRRIPAPSTVRLTGLSSDEVAEYAGITYRQLDHWLRRGYIPAPGTTSGETGSGNRRRWTQAEADRVALMASLVGEGLTVPAAAARAALPAAPVLAGW